MAQTAAQRKAVNTAAEVIVDKITALEKANEELVERVAQLEARRREEAINLQNVHEAIAAALTQLGEVTATGNRRLDNLITATTLQANLDQVAANLVKGNLGEQEAAA